MVNFLQRRRNLIAIFCTVLYFINIIRYFMSNEQNASITSAATEAFLFWRPKNEKVPLDLYGNRKMALPEARANNEQNASTINAATEASVIWRPKNVKVPSGWDERGLDLYENRKAALPDIGFREITFWHFQHRGQFYVSKDECKNRNFWEIASRGGWEKNTFTIFEKHVVPNVTIVVDFGTWIGPTLLHHGSFSRHSFGIEADPVAYAVAQYNVNLNRNRTWGNHVTLDSGCIARPEDVGLVEMKAGGAPGKSMSGIGDKVAQDQGDRAVKWLVDCYTLPDMFDNYWGIEKPYKDVFIKIDVESYECKLIPSFYDWLKDETYLPKMYITFHPQIALCTDDEYEGVLKFLRLYDHVRPGDKSEISIQSTTIEDFKSSVNWRHGVVLYRDAPAESIPETKR